MLIASAADVFGGAALTDWLHGSVVVSEEGAPLVLYHGTGAEISDENWFRGMVWGSVSPELAGDYAELRGQQGGAPNLMPLHMRIRKPFDADVLPSAVTVKVFFECLSEQAPHVGRDALMLLAAVVREGAIVEESGPYYSSHDFWVGAASLFGRDGAQAIREAFEVCGFDGIKMHEAGVLTYGAFHPHQVRSVVASRYLHDADGCARESVISSEFHERQRG